MAAKSSARNIEKTRESPAPTRSSPESLAGPASRAPSPVRTSSTAQPSMPAPSTTAAGSSTDRPSWIPAATSGTPSTTTTADPRYSHDDDRAPSDRPSSPATSGAAKPA